jgi:hypothetical protein
MSTSEVLVEAGSGGGYDWLEAAEGKGEGKGREGGRRERGKGGRGETFFQGPFFDK